jgi:hypothetical protein
MIVEMGFQGEGGVRGDELGGNRGSSWQQVGWRQHYGMGHQVRQGLTRGRRRKTPTMERPGER